MDATVKTMSSEILLVLVLGVFLIAILYSSVGHAGASGYIAVMALLSLAPEVIKPTALTLNILVATIATWQFYKAGHFSWSLFWPFAVLAVPFAYIGGHLQISTQVFKILLGLILLYASFRFFFQPKQLPEVRDPPKSQALISGAGI